MKDIILMYELIIEFYEKKIFELEENKPFFFQRKKLNDYNLQKAKLEQRLSDIYKKIQVGVDEEIKFINKFNKKKD